MPAAELSAWRDAFLAAGEASLKTRPADGRDDEIGHLKAKVGAFTMANELLATKIEHLEARGALWHGGGRDHEPPGLALHQHEPTASLRVARFWGHARATLYRHRRCETAGFQATAWSGWTDAGRGAGRGDPRVARFKSFPRRGPSQDLGAAALRRRPHRQTPRPAG